jgi:hypothetical protein
MESKPVMAGLVPAIHVSLFVKQDVDARHKAGHDGAEIVMQAGGEMH